MSPTNADGIANALTLIRLLILQQSDLSQKKKKILGGAGQVGGRLWGGVWVDEQRSEVFDKI